MKRTASESFPDEERAAKRVEIDAGDIAMNEDAYSLPPGGPPAPAISTARSSQLGVGGESRTTAEASEGESVAEGKAAAAATTTTTTTTTTTATASGAAEGSGVGVAEAGAAPSPGPAPAPAALGGAASSLASHGLSWHGSASSWADDASGDKRDKKKEKKHKPEKKDKAFDGVPQVKVERSGSDLAAVPLRPSKVGEKGASGRDGLGAEGMKRDDRDEEGGASAVAGPAALSAVHVDGSATAMQSPALASAHDGGSADKLSPTAIGAAGAVQSAPTVAGLGSLSGALGGGSSPTGLGASSSLASAPKQLGVADALEYLDKVKRQFHDRLEVYNQFLEIMKNFKSHNIDTPGVINHVCELFKGHDNLILGFNTFLPPGFKIELPNRAIGPTVGGRPVITQNLTLAQQQALMQQQVQQNQLQRKAAAQGAGGVGGLPALQLQHGLLVQNAAAAAAAVQQQQGAGKSGKPGPKALTKGVGMGVGGGGGGVGSPPASGPGGLNLMGLGGRPLTFQQMGQMSGLLGEHGLGAGSLASTTVVAPGQQLGLVQDDAGNAGAQGQPVEFDHAINYVTKIKKRFSHDTETYKTFLDILHSYQNEQRSIKEVLEQVSQLFKDHSDLLKEFTYFLPDAVRETAKTELVRRAAKAQRASKLAALQAKASAGGVVTGPGGKKVGGLSLGGENDDTESRLPQLERNLLGRIKAALGTRELWAEFLKCLDLFAQELISRSELLALISDIFGERGDLLEEFDRLLASRGATDDPVESAWFSMPLTDIDFANCRRCTPSYRALPAAYPKAPCSERTAMCRSVLNDTWVSVPLGSEDSTNKNNRRNPYQEALFKCEDDRYEVDMVVDSNKSAIRALEPLMREIDALGLANGNSSKFRYRLEKRTLSVIHLKAISRIYGDHGTEVLELLRRNPAGAIPIILKRLKEKDEEWCRDREELNKTWKEQMERNYSRSLDHRSFYFKQQEKRSFTHKVLLGEIKDRKLAATQQHHAKGGEELDEPKEPAKATGAGGYEAEDHMVLPFEDPALHLDVWGLLTLRLDKSCDKRECEKIAAFYAYFCHPFFGLPQSWLRAGEAPSESLQRINPQLAEAEDLQPTIREDAIPDGTRVQSPYGFGIVLSYDLARGMYTVKMAYGTAYLRPNIVSPAALARGARSSDIAKRKHLAARPVKMNDSDATRKCVAEDKAPCSQVFYVTSAVYVFVRQYAMLYDRLHQAKTLVQCMRAVPTVKHVIDRVLDDQVMQVDQGTGAAGEMSGGVLYTQLLSLVYGLLNGSLDSPRFEDEARTLVGPDIYFLFTIDKLVLAMQKQLSVIVSDEKSAESLRLLRELASKGETYEARDLARIFHSSMQHLAQDGAVTCLRMRFSKGVLNDPNVLEPRFEPVPLPQGAIIAPRKKLVSHWKVPPRLGISLTDEPPVQLAPVKDKQVSVPCAVEIANDGVLSIAAFNTSSLTAPPAGKTFALPVYTAAKLAASPEVVSVIQNFQLAQQEESAADKKTQLSIWYLSLLAGERISTPISSAAEKSPAPMENASTPKAERNNTESSDDNPDDVDMKDADE